LCLLPILSGKLKDISRNEKIVFAVFILFYLASALSFFYSENHDDAGRKLVLKLPILFFPLASLAFKQCTENTRLRLATILNYAFFLPSVISVYNYLINKKLFDQLILESKPLPIEFGYGIYHIQFSIILASAIVFGSFSIIRMLRGQVKDLWFWVLCILTVINFICIHILSARTGLLAMYAGLLIVLLGSIKKTSAKTRLYLISACVIVPLALFFSSTSLQNRLKNSLEDMRVVMTHADANDYSFAMRVAGWGNAVDVIQRHAAGGVGIGDADKVLYDNFATFNPSIQPQNRRNPHNQLLENAVQSGLFSSFLFLLCIFLPMIFRAGNFNKPNYLFVALALLIFTSSNFESILERQASVVAFSVLLALGYTSLRDPERENSSVS
jgi:O-antigen ligase